MRELDENAIAEAAAKILAGGLVAVPTETVYGLAADATNDDAVARIFEAKSRPQFNPLIIHVASIEMAKRYVAFPALASKLAKEFWPGPLTMVLPRHEDSAVSFLVSAGFDTIAVRMPDHATAQALITAVDRPLAAPSANRSGTISPTTADHVRTSLGDKVDLILDGDACAVGIESTIVEVEGDAVTLLRPGGIARATIERFLGQPVCDGPHTKKPQAPGMLESHYAPRAALRLNASAPEEGEAFLGFGAVNSNSPYALNLSPAGDLREAAAHFFKHLHALDRIAATHRLKGIAAAPVPMEGLGEAINDRMVRAAAPRSSE